MNGSEHDSVTAALTAARNGGASLNQLMAAHQIAEKYQLPHTTAEIRQHVRTMIPDARTHISATRGILLGIVSGVFTNYVLKAVERLPHHP